MRHSVTSRVSRRLGRAWKLPRAFAVLVSLVMTLGVFSPYLAMDSAAAPADTSGETTVAQDGTTSLEVDVVRCPADFNPDDVFGTCTAFGIDGVNVQVTSVDPALGVDLTQATETPGGEGPGRTTFTNLPAGDYTLNVLLPGEDGVRYSLYCGVSGGGAAVPTTPTDALTATVSVPDATAVGCDLYVIPTEIAPPADPSTLDVWAFTCEAGSAPEGDNLAFEDYRDACTTPAEGVEFSLKLNGEGPTQATNAEGRTQFSFAPGSEATFYAGVPLEATEVLFCALGQGEAEEITIDDTGVSKFANAETENRTCSWFLVEDEAPATEAPATEAPATEAPVTEAPATEAPATEAPVTEAPATEAPTTEEPGEVLPGDELAQVSVFAMACPEGFDADASGTDYATLSANCGEGVEDVTFTMGFPGGDTAQQVTDGTSPLVFGDLQPGSYTLYSSVPLAAADEFVFCTIDGGERYEKTFSDRGVTTFSDLETEQVDCEWYIVPTSERGEENGGSLEIHLSACPADFSGGDIFDACHSNGLAGYDFTIDGPDGEQTGATVITQQNGPGIVTFTSLAPGEYTIQGGPPGDFGSVELFCSTQPDNGTPEFSIDGVTATLNLGENEHVLCDWYFLPEDGSGSTPTPTPEPSRAEIVVTLYACPAADSGAYGGIGLGDFQKACTEKVNDVSFRIGDPDSAPLSAKTGSSGEGAVRFYDLLPGDLTMTPSLPSGMTSAAVFCTIGDGDPYQKALSNGGTTFVDVDGESISCSWFAVKKAETRPTTPSGSITIREYLCEKDRSAITDWDAECAPGSTGTSYTITNTASGADATGTPGANGVYVFKGLADGYYNLKQNDGVWCRAVADRVDSQSRVIVNGGTNTDVVLYQCNAIAGLPITGSGPAGTISNDFDGLTRLQMVSVGLMLIALPLAALAITETRRVHQLPPSDQAVQGSVATPTTDSEGRTFMRFR